MFDIFRFIHEKFFGKSPEVKQEDQQLEKDNINQEDQKFVNDICLQEEKSLEKRAYEQLFKKYGDADSMIHSRSFDHIDEAKQKLRLEDKKKLRTIKTLRSEEEINIEINSGHKVLRENVKPSKEIYARDLHIKDIETGEISIKPYSYRYFSIGDDRYEVKEERYYPYKFPSKIAAYLLPDDLTVGERVILEDIIEDIVGASRPSGTYRQDSAEAIWDGKKFIVDTNSIQVIKVFG